MRNKRRTYSAGIIGLVLIAVTLLIFFTLISERESIHWISLAYIVLAELISIIGFIAMDAYAENSSGMMVRAGAYSLISLYLITTVVIAVRFLMGSANSIKWLITIQSAILAVAVILMVLLVSSSKSVSEKNRETLESISKLQKLESAITILKNNPDNSSYSAQLGKVYEAIKYSDHSKHVPADNLIANKIAEIEQTLEKNTDDKDERVNTLLNETLLLSKKRDAEVKSMKTGGI